MSGKFKVGPAKTQEGREVRILCVTGSGSEPIVGQLKNGSRWDVCSWCDTGEYACGFGGMNLVPNSLPDKASAEGVTIVSQYGILYPVGNNDVYTMLTRFQGKNCRMTLEEILK